MTTKIHPQDQHLMEVAHSWDLIDVTAESIDRPNKALEVIGGILAGLAGVAVALLAIKFS